MKEDFAGFPDERSIDKDIGGNNLFSRDESVDKDSTHFMNRATATTVLAGSLVLLILAVGILVYIGKPKRTKSQDRANDDILDNSYTHNSESTRDRGLDIMDSPPMVLNVNSLEVACNPQPQSVGHVDEEQPARVVVDIEASVKIPPVSEVHTDDQSDVSSINSSLSNLIRERILKARRQKRRYMLEESMNDLRGGKVVI